MITNCIYMFFNKDLRNCLSVGLAAFLLPLPALSDGEVNVYSYRKPDLVAPLFKAFTDDSGIQVNVVSAQKGLVERLRREGRNSPADLIFTVDIGRLSDAREAALTQPVQSPDLLANIPASYREPEGHWFGLTTRGRIIVTSRERMNEGEILSYEDLADPKFKGRICTRSGKHVYMVALIASVMLHNGEDATRAWLDGLKANLARKPQGNDRAQVKAIAEGECDIAVINTYYLGKMANNPEQLSWYEAVRPVFPNQQNRGTHLNIAGMALTANAPNRDNAIKLMEYLSGDAAQQIYAKDNHEYPVKAGVPWSDIVRSWGEFKADTVKLSEVAKLRNAASKLVDEIDYDG